MHNLNLMNVSIRKLQLEELLYHNTLQVSLRILKNTHYMYVYVLIVVCTCTLCNNYVNKSLKTNL